VYRSCVGSTPDVGMITRAVEIRNRRSSSGQSS
jgi:hypothetical protein